MGRLTYPFIFDIQAKWCIDVGLQSVVQVVEANVKFGPAAIAREVVDSGGRSLSAIVRQGRLQLLRSAHFAIERTYRRRDTISSGILRDWLSVVPLLSAVQSPMDSGFRKLVSLAQLLHCKHFKLKI